MRGNTLRARNGHEHVGHSLSSFRLFSQIIHSFKWKEDNSLDFRLILRFPADATSPDQPDFYAKPIFLLYAWFGGSNYEVYDKLTVDDDEWLRFPSFTFLFSLGPS